MTDPRNRPIYTSFELQPPDGGAAVRVRVGRTFRSIRLRVKNGVYCMSAPAGITYAEALDTFLRLRRRLGSVEPPRVYSLDMMIDYPEGQFAVKSRLAPRSELLDLRRRGVPSVLIPESFDITNPDNNAAVTSAIIRLARPRAEAILLPKAAAEARRLGLRVNGWKTGTGLRTLGTCSTDRVITLSAAAIFLPDELRRYLICHELAHLTEMNHSARFHALCDSYLGGREQELVKALRAFRWPIIR